MEYIVDGRKYSISYESLKEQYHIHCQMTDDQFIQNLPSALHLAVVICFFKEIPGYVCLCDVGIIHELTHLIHIPMENTTSLRDIRKLFEEMLKLA